MDRWIIMSSDRQVDGQVDHNVLKDRQVDGQMDHNVLRQTGGWTDGSQ